MGTRSYYPSSTIPKSAARWSAQDMARYVEPGAMDAGITGRDWVPKRAPTWSNWPNSSMPSRAWPRCAGCWRCRRKRPIHSVKDLEGKVIATEGHEPDETIPGAEWREGPVDFSWGATEVKCRSWPMPLLKSRRPARPAGEPLADRGYGSEFRRTVSLPIGAAMTDPWKKRENSNVFCCCTGAITPITRSA